MPKQATDMQCAALDNAPAALQGVNLLAADGNAHTFEYLHNCKDKMGHDNIDGRTHQARALDKNGARSTRISSASSTTCMAHANPEAELEPADLKKLRCRILQIESLLPSGGCQQGSATGIDAPTELRDAVSAANDAESKQVHGGSTDHVRKELGIGRSELEDELNVDECRTPTAREQRIPQNLVCPPAPLKKKPTSLRRNIRRRLSAHPCSLLDPADIDAFLDNHRMARAPFRKL